METLFGHGAELTAIDALGTERCVTVSRDRTCRVWKIADEAQLLFVPPAATTGSIDCVRWCSDTRFVSGGQDGFVQLWSTSKRKPLSNVQAHEAWVSSVAAMPGSDVVISGSCGQVGIHSLVGDDLQHVKNVAVRGWVNAASMTRDGRIAVLALGQEHRLGRWFVSKEGRSGIAIMPLVKSDVE
jgi:ribosomal RNA-processing protein 9